MEQFIIEKEAIPSFPDTYFQVEETPYTFPQTLRLLADTIERYEKLADLVATHEKAIEKIDRLSHSEGTFNLTMAAKTLQMPPKKLIEWLYERDWIYRPAPKAPWLAQSDKMPKYLVHKTKTIRTNDEPPKVYHQVLVTIAGLIQIAAELKGAPPLH
ncbi:phage antirepressor KilAC domain-containing protein [Propionivibrio dicarboxylicus]|uniref:Phage antirepressor protein KilAC domain-containing protein n=1 Tax=Propionivibrio dicarboxylicus TaxID=83767 RepID=A0A1G8FW05_9RHOO|nr:phage antirepressor KilAC domain-containing protein [Propionivibrio dicarboxylicus]SDH86339.1 Phage antirepressor protein KilAC domain-containing protein [Propionivibrio dicarboxylicus]